MFTVLPAIQRDTPSPHQLDQQETQAYPQTVPSKEPQGWGSKDRTALPGLRAAQHPF